MKCKKHYKLKKIVYYAVKTMVFCNTFRRWGRDLHLLNILMNIQIQEVNFQTQLWATDITYRQFQVAIAVLSLQKSDIWTERQKDRKTERQKDRKTERQKDRKIERQND